MVLAAFGIDRAMFYLVQLCQITLALAQLSLHTRHTSWIPDGGQGASGNHPLASKWLFNVRSSICSNPYSRFLHHWNSQSKVFIKKKKNIKAMLVGSVPTVLESSCLS